MERAKAERTVLRRRFTLCCKKLENLLVSNDDIHLITVEFNKLRAIYNDLTIIQNKVLNLWLDDETRDESLFTQDIDTDDEYLSQWYSLEHKVSNYVELNNTGSVSKHTCTAKELKEELASQSSYRNRRYRLPKLEMPTFNGELKKWLTFWTQFQKIHNDDAIDKDDKFQYLLQCMEPGSIARELVESFPPSGSNYENVIEQLKQRFARDELIIEHYVRELLLLVLAQAKGVNKMPLRSLYDKINTQVLALESMKVTQEKYAAFLYPLVESALPEDLLKAWHRSTIETDKSVNSLSKLLEFVRHEVESDERIRLARAGFSNSFHPMVPSTSCFTASDGYKNRKGNKPMSVQVIKACLFCDKTTHTSSECVTAVNKTIDERIEIVKQKKACGICLNIGHYWKNCRKHPKCVVCGKRHYPLMCTNAKQCTKLSENKVQECSEQVVVAQSNKTVLLQTVKVKLISTSGSIIIRALLDSGAQRSFIKTDIVNKLKIKCIGKQELSHNLFGGAVMNKKYHNLYNVNICSIDNSYSCNIDVLEQDVICGYIPQIRQGKLLNSLINLGIFVSDCIDEISEISMLIGSDVLGSLFTGRAVQVENNLLAVETKLGWTIQGPAVGVYSNVNNVNTVSTIGSVEHFWELESIGITDDAVTKCQRKVESEVMAFFNNTISVNKENRYEVRLPWNEKINMLRPNFDLALKRLHSTTNRLTKLNIIKDYDLVFEEWVKDGIIEEVNEDDSSTGHYLPHHAVVKESSITTKIRPVFDASCKDYNALSLNSCLEKGINLIELIPRLLVNFRRNAIGITADIKKAFLQISLHTSDRNFLKFLWWRDINACEKVLKVYRHRRVVFGVTTSPFLLAATILYHLNKFKCETSSTLIKSFYVDNCVLSVKNEDEMHKFIAESKQIMLNGQFELRCWVTGPIITDTNVNSISVLGITWDPYRDELLIKAPVVNNFQNFTKRKVFSLAQGIFDPIGFLSPITLIPKLVIQKCWMLNLDWDHVLPHELNKVMETWASQIHLTESCRIPRRLSHTDVDNCENTVHIFCDASQAAYSCCIYLRSQDTKAVSVQLVMAKSRVAPTKHITMPRLELIAALLGTRLMSSVKESLDLSCKVFYWTDSSIVLAWLKRREGLNVFVHNRVVEILQRSKLDDWRHVPGIMNPADLPSRGCNPEKLMNSKWWLGPEWLQKDHCEWPTSHETPDEMEVLKELKKGCHILNNVNTDKFSIRLSYFSKYSKVVRMIAWCFRFLHNCCRGTSKVYNDLDATEYAKAEKTLLHIIQVEDNIEGQAKMKTYIDEDGLHRVVTRLTISDNPVDFKYPILLLSRNVIIDRLVAQRHIELLHAGSQTLISNLREKYWIVGVRRLAKRIVKRCVICRRHTAKACNVPTAPLPWDRINCGSVFESTGVDLAGPLLLKSNQKAWIILFTCATYRAVHLELTTSLSTEEFMLALRRFLARRGGVRVIYSDNGTNLRGASNLLNGVNWQDVSQNISTKNINWRFIPPSAPWWGGFWERMVRTMKEILRKILGKAALRENELFTILCEVEAVINSRPLTYIADSEENLRPLTPLMFLCMNSTNNDTIDYINEIDSNILTTRWRYMNNLSSQLKKRFRDEYLSLLTENTKKLSGSDLKAGDVVLIGSDDARRVNWPLGLILELIPGVDGYVRVARIKTATGERVRAVQRLYRLEVSHDDAIVDKANRDINTNPDSASIRVHDSQDKYTTRIGRTVKIPVRLDL